MASESSATATTAVVGRCRCGEVEARLPTARIKPCAIFICHCTMCPPGSRTDSYSGGAPWVGLPRAAWSGPGLTAERTSAFATRLTCGTCGTCLSIRYDCELHTEWLHALCMDDKVLHACPRHHIHTDMTDLGDGVPCHAGYEPWEPDPCRPAGTRAPVTCPDCHKLASRAELPAGLTVTVADADAVVCSCAAAAADAAAADDDDNDDNDNDTGNLAADVPAADNPDEIAHRWYAGIGSMMNQNGMRLRGIKPVASLACRIDGYARVFNPFGFANLVPASGGKGAGKGPGVRACTAAVAHLLREEDLQALEQREPESTHLAAVIDTTLAGACAFRHCATVMHTGVAQRGVCVCVCLCLCVCPWVRAARLGVFAPGGAGQQ